MTTASPPVAPPSDVGLLDVEESVGPQVVLEGDGVEAGAYPPRTFHKIVSGMATLAALIVATYFVPALHFARPWVQDKDPTIFWNLVGRELLGEGAAAKAAEQKTEEAERLAATVARHDDETPVVEHRPVVEPPPTNEGPPPYEPHPDDQEPVPESLELPSPTALDPFYEALTRTDARYAGAITRVSHWGDSAIANDNVTSALRFAMQRRFGDAGHGFHLVTKPFASYRHQGVKFSDGEGWQRCFIIGKCRSDGRYGFGGTIGWSAGGADSHWSSEERLAFGRKVSRLEIWYRAYPKGGRVRIKIDGGEPQILSTAAETAADAWHTVTLSDDAHDIGLRASGGGQARLYGVVLERDGPGVVWDGMAQQGAFTSRMLYFDQQHLREQIDHRDPALLVFMFGGNDLILAEHKLPRYEEDFEQVLRNFRGSDPPRACLVLAPVDHGQRQGQRIVSRPMVAKIVEAQRRASLAAGCAFFDTVAAMGGDGSAARWRKSKPPLLSGDLAHLTFAGQKVVGQMTYLALMEGYVAYRGRTP